VFGPSLTAPLATAQRVRTLLTAGLVATADQATKALVIARLAPGQVTHLIGPYLWLVRVDNTGAAFSLMRGADPILAGVAAVLCAAIAWASGRTRRPALAYALGLMLGGAAGNLVDRLVRHGVVDFLDVRIWPVFNLADAALTIGAVWLVVCVVWAPDEARGG